MTRFKKIPPRPWAGTSPTGPVTISGFPVRSAVIPKAGELTIGPVQAGTVGARPLLHADGSEVKVGDLKVGQTYTVRS